MIVCPPEAEYTNHPRRAATTSQVVEAGRAATDPSPRIRRRIQPMTRPICVILLAGIVAGPLTAQPASQQETLYARMGGYDGIARLVDTAFPRVAAHPQLRRFFQGHARDSQMRQGQRILDILCAATGGPCLYTGAPMPSVHRGLGITADDWRVFMQIISTALDDLKVPDLARRDFIELFERRFRAEVVETAIKPTASK